MKAFTARLLRVVPTLLALAAALAACQSDLLPDDRTPGTPSRLTAKKNAMLTRSVPPNANFTENTRYRLWAYDGEGAYLFDPNRSPKRNGIPARESSGKYIEMDPNEAQRLRTRFDVYGFTDCLTTAATDFTAETGELEAGGTYERPSYAIRYDEQISEGFRDYMRGELSYNLAAGETSPIVEFEHILSRVRVQVIQQGDEDADGDGKLDGIYELRLYSAQLTDMYAETTYDVIDGTHAYGDTPARFDRTLKEVAEGEPVIPAEATDAPFSESYVIPTALPRGGQSEGGGGEGGGTDTPSTTSATHTLRLVIGGADAEKFSQTLADGYNDRYVVEVALTDRYAPNEDGSYTEPLEFQANSSYMLRVVFARDGIVTFSPEVYPWFDGETEGYEDGEGYEEQALGNTFLFNNLIWSDRNLGAEDYYPRDLSRYEACTGFYYQYQRNIPYFPMVLQNGKLTDRLTENTKVYPVISHPTGRLTVPEGFDQKQTGDTDDEEAGYITHVENLYEEIAAGKSPAYFFYQSGFQHSNLWDDPSTQPVPPGWKIPSIQDFYSILPSCTYAGNITFQRVVAKNGSGVTGSQVPEPFTHSATTRQESYEEFEYYPEGDAQAGQPRDLNIIYCNVPTDPERPNVPSGKDNGANSHTYKTGGPDQTTPDASGVYTPTPAYDPEPGYRTEYLISKRYDDELGIEARKFIHNGKLWGVIYGIKKVGTDEAYRMRWRIENADPANRSARYNLVIERYTAKATDHLSYNKEDPNYYRKYDWTRPVAVLYLPIVGMIADAGWTAYQGGLGNYGSEVLYATTEPGTPIEHATHGKRVHYQTARVYHIKIYGTDGYNQFIAPADDRRGTGAQLRLVRESTYQSSNDQ